MNDDEKDRIRAENRSRKLEQAREGEKAMAQYEAANQAIREKTERLRALRLAKEAKEQEEAARKGSAARPAARKKTAAAKAKSEPQRLSDWLNAQGRSGRRT